MTPFPKFSHLFSVYEFLFLYKTGGKIFLLLHENSYSLSYSNFDSNQYINCSQDSQHCIAILVHAQIKKSQSYDRIDIIILDIINEAGGPKKQWVYRFICVAVKLREIGELLWFLIGTK